MTLIDLHIHGAPWLADNDWASYRLSVWNAWNAGCEYIGVSEHGPRFNHRAPFRSIYFSEFDRYFNTLEEIRLEFAGAAEVLSGLELDYNERMLEHYRDLLPKLPLDYIIGSVHTLKDWMMGLDGSFQKSSLAGADSYQLYDLYLAMIREAAKSGMFDFIGHPDYLKKFLPALGMSKPQGLLPMYRQTVEMLKACDVGVELNLSGVKSPAGEYYPDDDFLLECARANIPLTIGSDSHDIVSAGLGIEEGLKHAIQLGFSKIHIWRKRERIALDI